MHIYTHIINLDNVPESAIKTLRYTSFLNLSIPELEVLSMLANNQLIPADMANVAQSLRNDISNTLAESLKAIADAQPAVEGVVEAPPVTE